MGYRTTVRKSLTIDPPLTDQEIRSSYLSPATYADTTVKLAIDETAQDNPDGTTTTVLSAAALVPRWNGSYPVYTLVSDVQNALDTFPGHTFSGYLECQGERASDLWRVTVINGLATEVRPTVTWPVM